MDRVLYFAQYVVTHVDEEARQKALKRLEADLEEQREQLETVAQEGIEALKQRLIEEETQIEERREAIRSRRPAARVGWWR